MSRLRRRAINPAASSQHEEIRRGGLGELATWAADGVRGEVTVVLASAGASDPPEVADLLDEVSERVAAGERLKDVVTAVASAHGVPNATSTKPLWTTRERQYRTSERTIEPAGDAVVYQRSGMRTYLVAIRSSSLVLECCPAQRDIRCLSRRLRRRCSWKLRSYLWWSRGGLCRGGERLAGFGVASDNIGKPIIAVVSSFTEFVPGYTHFRQAKP